VPHDRVIGEHNWTVETFNGREGLALFRTLVALAGEPIFEAVKEAVSGLDPDAEVTGAFLLDMAGGAAGLAGKLATKLGDDELFNLSKRLLGQTLCDGQSTVKMFEQLFKGNVLLLFQVLAFVVEVNFIGPFASFLGPAVSSALGKMSTTIGSAIGSTPETSSVTNTTP